MRLALNGLASRGVSGAMAFGRRWRFRIVNNQPSVFYGKWFVAPSILHRDPIVVERNSFREIHILVSRKDFLMAMWALQSFYTHAPTTLHAVVHDDGTLTTWHAEALARLFPNARLIARTQSDEEMMDHLRGLPLCQGIRRKSCYSLKVLDFPYYCRSESMILLDSDVLFFKEPTALVEQNTEPHTNLFSEDEWTNYVYSVEEISVKFGLSVPPRVNIGVGLLWKACCDASVVEDILTRDCRLAAAPFVTDQTLIAMLAARQPVRLLPREYAVSLKPGTGGLISKHYTRLVRHRFYSEGIPCVKSAIAPP